MTDFKRKTETSGGQILKTAGLLKDYNRYKRRIDFKDFRDFSFEGELEQVEG